MTKIIIDLDDKLYEVIKKTGIPNDSKNKDALNKALLNGTKIENAKWLDDGDLRIQSCWCSNCHREVNYPSPFCPNCGRKMISSQENKVNE